MPSALPRVLLLMVVLAAPAASYETTAECPKGTHRVATENAYEPFKCVKDKSERDKGFGSVVGPKGFAVRPRCPRGTRPVAGDKLQPYRCVRVAAGETDPELAPLRGDDDAPVATEAEPDPMTRGCPPGKRKVRTTDPLNPYQCMVQATRVRGTGEDSYVKFSIPHELTLEYPRAFRAQDAWKEEVPTLYLTLDDGAPGKPVTITLTKYEQRQPTYQELDSAIARDVEWQRAQDGGVVLVAGINARLTYVPGDTRSVYVPLSRDSYYALVYSAPAETYDNYLPIFQHLLTSLRLLRERR